MPKSTVTERKNIRLPKPMMDEVDRVVAEHRDLFCNRQQFIESAVRQAIIEMRMIKTRKSEL